MHEGPWYAMPGNTDPKLHTLPLNTDPKLQIQTLNLHTLPLNVQRVWFQTLLEKARVVINMYDNDTMALDRTSMTH